LDRHSITGFLGLCSRFAVVSANLSMRMSAWSKDTLVERRTQLYLRSDFDSEPKPVTITGHQTKCLSEGLSISKQHHCHIIISIHWKHAGGTPNPALPTQSNRFSESNSSHNQKNIEKGEN